MLKGDGKDSVLMENGVAMNRKDDIEIARKRQG